MKLVAVTSCPTGIAHTYMAAEALEQAAHAAGHEIQVETQGAAGADPLAPEVIAAADAVIFGADVEVRDRHRFDGKPLITVSVKKAISDAPAIIEQAVEAARNAPVAVGAGAAGAPPSGPALASKVTEGAGAGTKVRQWLMTGVSYMIPFVAGGGILIAIGFMVSQAAAGKEGVVLVTKVPLETIATNFDVTSGMHWAALLFQIGVAAFAFLVPALAGFIAFAIADRPGIVPGFVGGALSVAIGAGFLGGIAAGFIGGFSALWLARRKVPKAVRGVMPVVVIPLLSVLFTGAVLLLVLGRPLKWVSDELTKGLNNMSGSNLIIMGVILGLMMAFDMGGPVNKVAYTFATTGLSAVAATATDATQLKVMAAVMAAGMTPPLGLALATVLRPKLFTEPERENGVAAWLLGASFITEGAIPFAAGDPLRVIPSLMAGSAVTGGLVMGFGSTLRAPHGGLWVTPLIGGILPFLVAVIVGMVVTAFAVIALKGARSRKTADVESDVLAAA